MVPVTSNLLWYLSLSGFSFETPSIYFWHYVFVPVRWYWSKSRAQFSQEYYSCKRKEQFYMKYGVGTQINEKITTPLKNLRKGKCRENVSSFWFSNRMSHFGDMFPSLKFLMVSLMENIFCVSVQCFKR